eukprot:1187440-Prorocentrum_minimum.AAC.2
MGCWPAAVTDGQSQGGRLQGGPPDELEPPQAAGQRSEPSERARERKGGRGAQAAAERRRAAHQRGGGGVPQAAGTVFTLRGVFPWRHCDWSEGEPLISRLSRYATEDFNFFFRLSVRRTIRLRSAATCVH